MGVESTNEIPVQRPKQQVLRKIVIGKLDTKMTEYDELGKLLKIRKEQQALIPESIDKKKKIRTKRKARKVLLKKWMINILDDC